MFVYFGGFQNVNQMICVTVDNILSVDRYLIPVLACPHVVLCRMLFIEYLGKI